MFISREVLCYCHILLFAHREKHVMSFKSFCNFNGAVEFSVKRLVYFHISSLTDQLLFLSFNITFGKSIDQTSYRKIYLYC